MRVFEVLINATLDGSGNCAVVSRHRTLREADGRAAARARAGPPLLSSTEFYTTRYQHHSFSKPLNPAKGTPVVTERN